MIHEYYVSLEISKLLKKTGFNWEVKTYYHYLSPYDEYNLEFDSISTNYNHLDNADFSAPTLDVTQRWLREVKGIHICVKSDAASINCKYFVTIIISDTNWGNVQNENKKTIMFGTYEEAQEAGIKKALKLILNKEE